MTLPLLTFQKRFVIYYEDEESKRIITFGTWAALASIAVARTVQFIDENKLHKSDNPYYLIPRIDRTKKVNYEF